MIRGNLYRSALAVALGAAILLPRPATAAPEGSSLAGSYTVAGRDRERGDYGGTVQITPGTNGAWQLRGYYDFQRGASHRWSATATQSGSTLTFRIRYRRSNGVFDRLADLFRERNRRTTTNLSITGTYTVGADGNLSGTWTASNNNRFNRTDTWTVDNVRITGVEPRELPQGARDLTVAIVGEKLPTRLQAADVAFLSGTADDRTIRVISVGETNDARTRLTVRVEVDRAAVLGARGVRVGGTSAADVAEVILPTSRLHLGSTDQITGGVQYDLFIPLGKGKLTLTAASGTIELRSPSGATLQPGEGGAYACDAAGVYRVAVRGATGSVQITNAYRLEARTTDVNTPWNFWYFPFYDRPGANQNLYGDDEAYAKLDRVLGNRHQANAEAFEPSRHMDAGSSTDSANRFNWDNVSAEERARYVTDTIQGFGYCYARSADPKKSWWGHCWGAVVASSLFRQPAARTVRDPNNAEVAFSEEEVEGLLTAFHTNHSISPTNYMNNCPAGRPTDRTGEDVDRYADDFLLGLIEGIGERGLPLASNLRAEMTSDDADDKSQVWNHVVWRYSAELREVAGQSDRTFVEVNLTVYATDDVFPSSSSASPRDEAYVMRFKFEEGGGLNRDNAQQNWVSAEHYAPSYLWRILRSSGDYGTENEAHRRVGIQRMIDLFGYTRVQ